MNLRRLIALALGLIAYLAFPSADGGLGEAQAAPSQLRAALEAVDLSVWTRTYEGYALAERALGRAIRSRADLRDFAQALEGPRFRSQLSELEDRLVRMESAVRAGEGSWEAMARVELSQAPLRASGRVEFISAPPSHFESMRDAFLTSPPVADSGEIYRDVQLFVGMGYGPFQADLLARAEALGLVVKRGYRECSVIVGRAPARSVRALSGIDGIDRLHVLERSARPEQGELAMAPQDFVRGVSVRAN